MSILIGLAVFIFAIITVIDTVKSTLPTEKKVLWILLIVFLPVLGIILYYLLGKPAITA